MIKFIKTLEYETRPENTDVFDYLCDVASQKIDPPTKSMRLFDLESDIVIYSSARRVAETIKINNKTRYIKTSLLKEIPFDLRSLCAKTEWEQGGSAAVRKGFIKAFIDDTLLLPRERIFNEIKKILDFCAKQSTFQEIAVISHSFRLKIFEAFIYTEGDIEKNSCLIKCFIQPEQKTYDFGKGFSVSKKRISSLALRL